MLASENEIVDEDGAAKYTTLRDVADALMQLIEDMPEMTVQLTVVGRAIREGKLNTA